MSDAGKQSTTRSEAERLSDRWRLIAPLVRSS
jgi:hypothetical protein